MHRERGSDLHLHSPAVDLLAVLHGALAMRQLVLPPEDAGKGLSRDGRVSHQDGIFFSSLTSQTKIDFESPERVLWEEEGIVSRLSRLISLANVGPAAEFTLCPAECHSPPRAR